MNKSESIKSLAVALTKAQSEIKSVKMDATNPFFKKNNKSGRYATLGAVIDVSKEILAKHNLVVTQLSTSNETGFGVTTLLMHNSGEWVEGTITIPFSEPTYIDSKGAIKKTNIAQEAGKAITYLRRYSLSSILNLYAEEDNDGNDTQSPPKSKETAQGAKSTRKKIDTPMSLDKAEDETGSDGVRYGDCVTDVLSKKMIGIAKWLNDNKE